MTAEEIRGSLFPSDAQVLTYLQSRGHSPEKAQQILTNHRASVVAEMSSLAPVAVAPVADPTAAPDAPGAGE